MQTTSPTLLEQLRQPNPADAWTRFARLYAPLLLTWAKRQGMQDADAADVTQDVLIKLIRLMPAFERKEGQTFRGWLFRVTTNQCQDFRRRRATRQLPSAVGLLTVADRVPTAELNETEYRQILVRQSLEVIRSDFSASTWTAFAGVMLEGRAAPSVAAELGLSENAVYLARHRVLTRLRQQLDGLLD